MKISNPIPKPTTIRKPGLVCKACGCEFEGLVSPELGIAQTLCGPCGNIADSPIRERLCGGVMVPTFLTPEELVARVRGFRKMLVPKIPAGMSDTDPDLLPCPAASKAAVAWRPGSNPEYPDGILLHGHSQTGKTRTAVLLSFALAENGKAVVWRDAGELCSEITRAQGEHYEHQLVSSLVRAEVLVLDDICNFGGAPKARSKLASIIKLRGERLAPTIITTQHNRHSIEAWFGGKEGEAIKQRLLTRYVAIHLSKKEAAA